MMEAIIATIVALAAAVAALFKLWRNAKKREQDAKLWAAATVDAMARVKRVHAASDAAKADTEAKVEAVRESVRQGRRDHFEGQ
jgi:uncharacterized protein YceH (UPF0502 family)